MNWEMAVRKVFARRDCGPEFNLQHSPKKAGTGIVALA